MVAAVECAVCRQPRQVPARATELRAKERKIEACVMRGDGQPGDVGHDGSGDIAEQRRVGNIGLRDAVNVRCADGSLRVEPGRPFVDDVAALIHSDDRELQHPILLGRQACRLHVDDGEVRRPRKGRRRGHPRCRRLLLPATAE